MTKNYQLIINPKQGGKENTGIINTEVHLSVFNICHLILLEDCRGKKIYSSDLFQMLIKKH